MAHNHWNAYADDRRSSSTRRESYRPNIERSQPARRDSRESRYTSESGEIRSPYENRTPREQRRDIESPRHNDAVFNPPEGPRRVPSNSVAGLPEKPVLPNKPGDGLHFNRINSGKLPFYSGCLIHNFYPSYLHIYCL